MFSDCNKYTGSDGMATDKCCNSCRGSESSNTFASPRLLSRKLQLSDEREVQSSKGWTTDQLIPDKRRTDIDETDVDTGCSSYRDRKSSSTFEGSTHWSPFGPPQIRCIL